MVILNQEKVNPKIKNQKVNHKKRIEITKIIMITMKMKGIVMMKMEKKNCQKKRKGKK